MIKKILSVFLCGVIVFCSLPITFATTSSEKPSFITEDTEGLYVNGISDNNTEGWQLWQNRIEEEYKGDLKHGDTSKNMLDINPDTKYFFMPSGTNNNQAIIYNGYNQTVEINGFSFPSKTTKIVNYETNTDYSVKIGDKQYTLIFKKSTAEGALFINNPDADGNGTELYKYLSQDKSNSAAANSLFLSKDGSVDTTSIKKIKGRGNTTWQKEKKPFNVTFSDNISIAGMDKGKKYTLLANYQDGALVRNRLLYDLSDAVGMPYASDSRFIDLYMNGIYYGTYQLCQKIEVGSKDLINDIDDEAYLNDDNTIASDFPFLMEIDPSAGKDDFNFSVYDTSVTINAPELAPEDVGYEEVKAYVSEKFKKLIDTLKVSASEESLNSIIDIDSFAKIFLINELGKNWDSGVSSLYMVYKQDSQGNWKFFASPVWDYDNSIGNCKGLFRNEQEYERYISPKNVWCITKGSSSNIIQKLAKCNVVKNYVTKIWFDSFLPALDILFSENVTGGEIYSTDVYYEILKGSAECNYTRGWFLDTNDEWIADHDTLLNGKYNNATKKYEENSTVTTYTNDFTGEYNYCIDWLKSRSGWLTAYFKEMYIIPGDANLDDVVDINDVTEIQRIVAKYPTENKQIKSSDINDDGIINIKDAHKLQRILANLE